MFLTVNVYSSSRPYNSVCSILGYKNLSRAPAPVYITKYNISHNFYIYYYILQYKIITTLFSIRRAASLENMEQARRYWVPRWRGQRAFRGRGRCVELSEHIDLD